MFKGQCKEIQNSRPDDTKHDLTSKDLIFNSNDPRVEDIKHKDILILKITSGMQRR